MEPPIKRRKMIQQSADTEDEDELNLEPEELNQRRDPAFQLEQGRALAANKLKSRFENIFAKYEKDFTGIGDEIDLMTGHVVVDNGHLQSMRSEKDAGDGQDYDEGDSSEEEERILHGRRVTEKDSSPATGMIQTDPWKIPGPSWQRPMMEGPPRLTSLFSSQPSFMSPSWSTPLGLETPTRTDLAWQAPEVPASAFLEVGNRFGVHGRLSLAMRSTPRKVMRKSLPAPVGLDADDEDVLLGMSGNILNKKDQEESPLIRRNFPPVDSPNEDTAHNDLINEIMGNLSDTSPSISRPNVLKRRGPGRPPKVKDTQTASSDPESGRKTLKIQGRRGPGRPPKVKDTQTASSDPESGRKTLKIQGRRGPGRPPKVNETQTADYDPESGRKTLNIQGRRGPGRPPKVKETQAAGYGPESAPKMHDRRGPGRPPKVKETQIAGFDPESAPKIHGRRVPGRPSKPKETQIAGPESAPRMQDRRGPGRPPKAKETQAAGSGPESERKIPEMQDRRQEISQIPYAVLESDDMAVQADQSDQFFWDESDQESFDDTIQNGFARPAGQILHADNMTTKSDSGEPLVREEEDPLESRVLDKTPIVAENMSAATRAPDTKFMVVNDTNPKFGGQDFTAQKDFAKPIAPSRKSHTEETFERNIVDPAFTFSDDETLLPRKARKDRRRTELVTPAVATPSQELQGNAEAQVVKTALDRNVVDPSYAFSDEENLLPKRAKRDTGRLEPGASAGDLMEVVPSAAPVSNQESTVDVHTVRGGIDVKSGPAREEQTDETTTTRPSLPNEQPNPIEAYQQRQPSSELGNSSPANISPASSAHIDRPDSEPFLKSAPAPQPSTPQPKSEIGKKMASPSTSLISLISNNEDSEDEISFDLADFTPSGHHRILALRPFPQLASSAKTTSSTSQKKKRASLIFGHHSASSHNLKTPRTSTPGSGSRDRKNKHRRSSTSLARSIVRVHHDRDTRAVSPTGSVIQTPGGTKRRCGQDGFTCDRDFCFVCL